MNGNKFSKKELRLVMNKSLSHTQVARLTGRNVASIFTKRESLGLIGQCSGSRKTWASWELERIINPIKPITVIAKELGRSYPSVYSMYRELKGE